MSDLENSTDEQLIALVKEGHDLAFSEIYNRHWEKMADYAIRLTRSQEEGFDIVQEIFVSLWNRRAVLDPKGSLISYLIKSTRNLSLRHIEKNLHKENFLERFTISMEKNIPDFEDKLSLNELQTHIDRTVTTLPRKMREIYVLSRDEQLSHKEIAAKLGIAENTVKKQINNALKILSVSLKTNFPVTASLFFIHFLK